MSDKWRSQSAAELGRGIAEGAIDPRELAEVFLDAIAARPDADRIFARLTPERARAGAEAAAKRARAGGLLGPLDGVPISWKDNYDIAGEVTEAGTRLLAGRVPDKDATAFARATAQGLVCLGKTHMTELAFSGLGVNPRTATPPNAIAPDRAPGGSSSGAAVSCKLGLAAAGIGSDTGGSVRVPASWNDLAGLKTTAGLIPSDGVVPLSTTLDTVGPLCRTVEDCGLLTAAMAGLPMEVPGPADLSGVSLLVPETVVLDDLDPEVAAMFDAALAALERAGVRLTRARVPEIADAFEVASTVCNVAASEGWRIWGAAIEANPGVMWERIEKRFRGGMGATQAAERETLERCARLSEAVQAEMRRLGPMVMPATAILPPPVDRLMEDEDYFTSRNLMTLRNTRVANLLTLSALTLPTATPMAGLMLVAGPGAEDLLLALGRAMEPVVA